MRKTITLLLTVLLLCGLALPAHAVPVEQLSDEQGELPILDPKVEAMIAWALETAADDTHGYSQHDRFGPSYDCSSFVCTALMEGGFGLEEYILPSAMAEILPEYGFEVYKRGETEPQRGDILVRPGVHVEICMGGTDCVSAHHDYDGRSGDSTGHEIEYRTAESYYCPFCQEEEYTYILRYNPDLAPETSTLEDDAAVAVQTAEALAATALRQHSTLIPRTLRARAFRFSAPQGPGTPRQIVSYTVPR